MHVERHTDLLDLSCSFQKCAISILFGKSATVESPYGECPKHVCLFTKITHNISSIHSVGVVVDIDVDISATACLRVRYDVSLPPSLSLLLTVHVGGAELIE